MLKSDGRRERLKRCCETGEEVYIINNANARGSHHHDVHVSDTKRVSTPCFGKKLHQVCIYHKFVKMDEPDLCNEIQTRSLVQVFALRVKCKERPCVKFYENNEHANVDNMAVSKDIHIYGIRETPLKLQ